jgi:hypothetical protein
MRISPTFDLADFRPPNSVDKFTKHTHYIVIIWQKTLLCTILLIYLSKKMGHRLDPICNMVYLCLTATPAIPYFPFLTVSVDRREVPTLCQTACTHADRYQAELQAIHNNQRHRHREMGDRDRAKERGGQTDRQKRKEGCQTERESGKERQTERKRGKRDSKREKNRESRKQKDRKRRWRAERQIELQVGHED